MSVNIQTSNGLVKIAGTPTIDTTLSNVSKNPVQNKVVTTKIDEINRNLTQLEYSDIAGGKNINNNENTNLYVNISTTSIGYSSGDAGIVIDVSGLSAVTISTKVQQERYRVALCDSIPTGTNTVTGYNGVNKDGKSESITIQNISHKYLVVNATDISNIQVEKGTTSTPYEPYIPSVKMLSEEVAAQNESLAVIGKCKNEFNPILENTTKNGVICTKNVNGTGTYTLNGKSSGVTVFDFYSDNNNIPFAKGKTYKFIYLDNVPQYTAFQIYVDKGNGWENIINNSSGSFNLNVLEEYRGILIRYLINESNVTFDNLIVKPMVTENLNATYDDFVPYTGNGETLTHDVADLKNDLGGLSFSVNGSTLTITNGTKTWTLT